MKTIEVFDTASFIEACYQRLYGASRYDRYRSPKPKPVPKPPPPAKPGDPIPQGSTDD